MEARIRLKNIGNFDEAEFQFRSGCLNILEMPNAAGKSIVLKSILAAYSFPLKSILAETVASRLGIWRKDHPQPLVRLKADSGVIELFIDGRVRRCIIESSGDVITDVEGDNRMLFTNFVSAESEVLRRISVGGDDLKWILPIVSNVEYYERALKSVSSVIEDLTRTLDLAKSKQDKLSKLEHELNSLTSDLAAINQQIEEVERELNEEQKKINPEVRKKYDAAISEAENLRKIINDKKNELRDYNNELQEVQTKLEDKNSRIESLKKKLKELENALKSSVQNMKLRKNLKRLNKN